MDAKIIRKEIKENLIRMTEEEYTLASAEICKKVLDLLAEEVKEAESFLCFSSMDTEPNLDPVYEILLKAGCSLYFPVSFNEGQMIFYRVRDLKEELYPGRWGIFEPAEDIRIPGNEYNKETLMETGEVRTVCFTPLVAFDADRNRIGHGGGYYDRLFEKEPELLKLGIAFECQRQVKIEAETWDVRLDNVVTEVGIF